MKRLAGLLGLLATLFGCGRSRADSPDCATMYGLTAVPMGDDLREGLRIANSILGGNKAAPVPAETLAARRPLPVVTISASGLGRDDFVFVPDGGACVLVTDRWPVRASKMFNVHGSGALAADPAKAIAIVLLHEAGHIELGDAGAYTASTPVSLKDVMGHSRDASNRELGADLFAADAIGAAARAGSPAFMDGLALTMTATNILWNLQAQRQLAHFGSSLLPTASAFGESGYSHPNIELRFLVVAHRIGPTPETHALLQSFLEKRSRVGEPGILYRTPE